MNLKEQKVFLDKGQMASVMVHSVSEACLFRFSINGVPVSRDEIGKSSNMQGMIHEWLRPRANKFSVRVDWPHSVTFRSGVARADVAVRLVAAGQSPQDVPPALSLSWPDPRVEETYPRLLEDELVITDFPETILWTQCAPIDQISARDREMIVELVKAFHTAYDRADDAEVLRLSEIKLKDLATCYKTVLTEDQDSLRESVRSLGQTDGWGLLPLQEDLINLEIVAEGRLAWVSGVNRQAIIRSKRMPTFAWESPIYAGKIGGVWQIVR